MTAPTSEGLALPAERAVVSDEPHARDRAHHAHSPVAGLTAIGPHASDRQLRESALVLSAVGIPHSLVHGVGGGFLLVRDGDYDRARSNLDSYEEENRNFPPRPGRARPRYGGMPVVALAFIALAVFAWVTGPVASPNGAFFDRGASVASKILDEPFRAVTALTLHADGAHVASNLVSGAIFGRALERRAGPGSALFGVVVAGSLGNVANALFYRSEGLAHASIGASTGVFAIVGLLASIQLVAFTRRSYKPDGKRAAVDYLAPVVGGFALLGALGASPSTDVLAHAFGFLAGLALGVPMALWIKRLRRLSVPMEIGLGAVALGVVGAAWGAAAVA
jgi:membrane associated rhomboid family serine protease